MSNHRDDCDDAGFAVCDSSNRRANLSENGRNSQKVALIEIQEMIASCGFALQYAQHETSTLEAKLYDLRIQL